METEQLLRTFKKKLIFPPETLPHKPAAGKEEIMRIIPHREPMLLLDSIDDLDFRQGLITGSRYMDPEDPVFSGHFPEYPVYPGSLEVEMIGQLGLCLYYFVMNETAVIGPSAEPVDLRATRVLGAQYTAPLLPESQALILAKKLDYDGFFGTALGQVVSGGKVCCTAVGEVVFP
jgi:3-hydroxymyristoyl/3-hydroxydecanoyl-(acyl carrier protein) dehydratase